MCWEIVAGKDIAQAASGLPAKVVSAAKQAGLAADLDTAVRELLLMIRGARVPSQDRVVGRIPLLNEVDCQFVDCAPPEHQPEREERNIEQVSSQYWYFKRYIFFSM